NVNATSWTLSSINGSNSGTGFTPGPWSNAGGGNVSTFGNFNQTINSFDGFGHSSDTISFTLTNNSGSWANAASVLIANASGWSVEAHIFVTSVPANPSNGAAVTGFAAGPTVPDGVVTLMLLGLALGGLGLVGRLPVRKVSSLLGVGND